MAYICSSPRALTTNTHRHPGPYHPLSPLHQGQNFVMAGEFPCLQVGSGADQAWSSWSEFNVPETLIDFKERNDQLDPGVKRCLPYVHKEDEWQWCHETTAECASVSGYATEAQCAFEGSVEPDHVLYGFQVVNHSPPTPYTNDGILGMRGSPFRHDAMANPFDDKAGASSCQRDCRLGLYNHKVGCVPTTTQSKQDNNGNDDVYKEFPADCDGRNLYWALHSSGALCGANLSKESAQVAANHRIVIVSRTDVTEIADFAFTHFPGHISVEGIFARLTTIGKEAFRNCSAAVDDESGQSRIHFGRNALPVLVSIEEGAFRDFRGQ